jgi:predicted O-methyltransferase YrrM
MVLALVRRGSPRGLPPGGVRQQVRTRGEATVDAVSSKAREPDGEFLLGRMERALAGVDGWLWPPEAGALYRSVRRVSRDRPATVVEIGSWEGRSTIALALGVLERPAGGRVFAIDPHVDADDRYERFRRNIERSDVGGVVTPIRDFSYRARPQFEQDTVDVLFVDGAHDLESVRQDITDWVPTLRSGATIAFNDPFWPGVGAALRALVAVRASPFRRPRLVINTLFFDYARDAPWRWRDELFLRRTRLMIRLGVLWLPWFERLTFSRRVPLWAKRLVVQSAWMFRILVPRGDLHVGRR